MASTSSPTSLAIGVDLGGTHCLAALMDYSGTVYARHHAKISAAERGSRDTIARALSGAIFEVWKHARDEHPACLPLRGVGIAVPGNVDPIKGLARYLPNFGWLEPVDLAALVLDCEVSHDDKPAKRPRGAPKCLRDLLGVDRIHIRNDGRCAALAERHFGVGASGEHEVLAMLTLGTGIGGALIHNPSPERVGSLFDGCSFDAGDFGHHVLRSGDEAFACVCGNRGCFECHASAAGLVRHWRALGGEEHLVSLDDAKTVVEKMRSGEPTAVAAWRAYRADLAAGLANLVTFYNPSAIVLGGGLARTPELYDGLAAAIDASTLPATRGRCAVLQSALSGDCAAIGAAWLVFSETDGGAEKTPAATATPAPPPPTDAPAGGGGVVVSVGLVCLDATVWVAAPPVADTKSVAERSLTCGGGNAANASVAAARLQAPVRLVTKVGADVHGEVLRAELRRDGVDLRWCSTARAGATDCATPTSLITVCGAARTIVHDPGLLRSDPLLPAEFDPTTAATTEEGAVRAWLEGAALLSLDGRHPAAALHAARCAMAAGVPILLDVERPRPGLDDLMQLADYVVSASDFPEKLRRARAGNAGGDGGEWTDPAAAAEYLLIVCPRARWVCLTLGAEGALAVERGSRGKVTRVPAWPLPASAAGKVRDTTGAGDAFIGATAAGLRRGLPLPDILRLASCVAATNCCADGARGGMPTLAELPQELRALLEA